MDIPNWRAIAFPEQAEEKRPSINSVSKTNERDFDLVYKAWVEFYPSLSAREIAERIEVVKVTTVQAYISQLNATQGDVPAAKLRIRLSNERSYIRNVLKIVDDPEKMAALQAIEADFTKRIGVVTSRKRTSNVGPKVNWRRHEAALKQAEWLASGIPD